MTSSRNRRYLPSTTATLSAVINNFGLDHHHSRYAAERRYDDSESYRTYPETTSGDSGTRPTISNV